MNLFSTSMKRSQAADGNNWKHGDEGTHLLCIANPFDPTKKVMGKLCLT